MWIPWKKNILGFEGWAYQAFTTLVAGIIFASVPVLLLYLWLFE